MGYMNGRERRFTMAGRCRRPMKTTTHIVSHTACLLAYFLDHAPMVTSPASTSHRTWHSFYSDPSDDIVFESRDTVFFRASNFRLAQTWWVFNG
jgi:hypothetical protein